MTGLKIRVLPQRRPSEDVEVDTRTEVKYWFHGPYRTEGPWSEAGAQRAKTLFWYQDGWWEKKTSTTVTVTERMDEVAS